MLQLSFLSLLVLSTIVVHAVREYVITNNCPAPITLYINGIGQGTLSASGGSTQRTLDENFSGFIYSDANGGNQNGAGTTRAGFFGEDNYYYIVVDPNHFNTAVSIQPRDRAPVGGYCFNAECSSVTCSTAFQQPPTAFPPPGSTPPAEPLFECPRADTGYTVTFCPAGTFPPPPPSLGRNLNPNINFNKCLDVRGGVFANGTPVQIYDCNGTGAQKWVINRGNTKVRVNGTNFCLDAGSNPASGVAMKIWTCYDNLPAQAWYYTDDNRIALTGKGQCLDLTNGVVTNTNKVQTWTCTDNNPNQIWVLERQR